MHKRPRQLDQPLVKKPVRPAPFRQPENFQHIMRLIKKPPVKKLNIPRIMPVHPLFAWLSLLQPPPKSKKQPEPDRFYAENLAAKNYFMGKEEPPPYGSRSGREEAHSSPPALHTPLSAADNRAAIAAAARELTDLRERWLNPPEWTVERILEFPGSTDGPWSRYVADPDQNGIGIVRYPRLEPRDADCAAELKQRTLTNLYNERPAWLDFAHKRLEIGR